MRPGAGDPNTKKTLALPSKQVQSNGWEEAGKYLTVMQRGWNQSRDLRVCWKPEEEQPLSEGAKVAGFLEQVSSNQDLGDGREVARQKRG